jgi:hypothetical protein
MDRKKIWPVFPPAEGGFLYAAGSYAVRAEIARAAQAPRTSVGQAPTKKLSSTHAGELLIGTRSPSRGWEANGRDRGYVRLAWVLTSREDLVSSLAPRTGPLPTSVGLAAGPMSVTSVLTITAVPITAVPISAVRAFVATHPPAIGTPAGATSVTPVPIVPAIAISFVRAMAKSLPVAISVALPGAISVALEAVGAG